MFKNMKIGVRLGLGFGLVLVLVATIAFIGITRLSAVQGNFELVVSENNVKIKLTNDMRGQVNVIARSVRNLALLEDLAEMKKEEERIQQARAKYNELRDKLDLMLKTEAAKKIMADIKDDQAKTRPLVDRAMAAGLANKAAEATAIILKEVRGP